MYLYCVGSEITDLEHSKKLGLTINPIHRMRTYNTGDLPLSKFKKRYDGLWKVTSTSGRELRSFEAVLHSHFADRRISQNSEWFRVSFEEVEEFLRAQSFVIRQLSIEEIDIIHVKATKKASEDESESIKEENSLLEEQKQELSEINEVIIPIEPPIQTLKEQFLSVFLLGKVPRRIQSELWDIFEALCKSPSRELYKGIVQWATGCGKTIGMLMMIVLSANRCKQRGEIYRGLLVAPTNDIFNTILPHIHNLASFDIKVCEGHDGKLSKLSIPTDENILIITTHAALTDRVLMESLPSINHVHYDEVHRITGEEFYNNLTERLPIWQTEFLTGTSATPKTCSPSQHKKLAELFGNPYTLLHRCDIDEAIEEGWIAQPRFSIHIVPKTTDTGFLVKSFLENLQHMIMVKQSSGKWRHGKVIAYLPSRDNVKTAVHEAKSILDSTWTFYSAVEGAEALEDSQFVKDEANGTVRILFACERYREGSDIFGLEMTVVLIGNTIAANILLQVAGRALRRDYEGKEGWCCIVRPCEDGTTEDEVFDSIMLYIMEFINKTELLNNKKAIKRIVETFLGQTRVNGKLYDIEETTNRIQAFYVRREFERGLPKEKYFLIRHLNQELGMISKQMYEERASEHPKYILDPKTYFKDSWISWYHFLGVDTTSFPQTKTGFIEACRTKGFYGKLWSYYKKNRDMALPESPGQMYEDFTNWDQEMGVEQEVVW